MKLLHQISTLFYIINVVGFDDCIWVSYSRLRYIHQKLKSKHIFCHSLRKRSIIRKLLATKGLGLFMVGQL